MTWAKLLALVFGNTTHAVSTILSAFMLGFGLGSHFMGKLSDKKENLLRMYGYMEAGIAAYALVFQKLLSLQEKFYFLYGTHASSVFASLFLFSFCFLILFLPAFLMGGTFPVLVKFSSVVFGKPDKQLGSLYAANTFGAAAGTLITGFFLIVNKGISGTIEIAVMVNLLIALLCIVLPVKARLSQASGAETLVETEEKPGRFSPSMGVLFFVTSASGFSAMVSEVAWTRIFALFFGSSTYAFSTMLASFLFGIGLGSVLFASNMPLEKKTHGYLGFLLLTQAFCSVLFILLVPELGYASYVLHSLLKNSYGFLTTVKFFLCFLALLLPTFLYGVIFPFCAELFGLQLAQLGRSVGKAYFANTLGSTLGAFFCGFLFIPYLGILGSLLLTAVLCAVSGNMLFASEKMWSKKAPAFLFSFLIVFGGLSAVPRWNKALLSAGVFIYTGTGVPSFGDFSRTFSTEKLIFYKEGVSSVVSVHEGEGHRFLRVNGKTDASTGPDMPTQLLLGHLPMLLAKSVKQAAVVGFGSGVSAASVARYPVREIHVIEIEPAVLETAPLFKSVNRDILKDRRVRTIIADGRQYLQASEKKFDVVILEPSNPWIAGIGNLYSREFYRSLKQKLNKGGVVCQWMHGYSMSPYLFRMILRTFLASFPNSMLWWVHGGDYLITGFKNSVPEMTYADLRKKMQQTPGVKSDLQQAGVSSPLSLSYRLLADKKVLKRITRGVSENTDDFPLLEYMAPMSLYHETALVNFKGILSLKDGSLILKGVPKDKAALARARFEGGVLFAKYGFVKEAEELLKESLSFSPSRLETLKALARLYVQQNRFSQAKDTVAKILQKKPKNHIQWSLLLADIYESEGNKKEAEQIRLQALEKDPSGFETNKKLSGFYFNEGNLELSMVYLQTALRGMPTDRSLLFRKGQILLRKKKYQEAGFAFQQAQNLQETSRGFSFLGDAALGLGKFTEAKAFYEKALSLDSTEIYASLGLGKIFMQKKFWQQAESEFQKALIVDPYNKEALEGLEVLEKQNKF